MLLPDQVQSAYEHLYDLVYLRTHPLVGLLVSDGGASRHDRAWRLHNILIEAVAELDPGPDVPVFSREWRRHRIMVMRYLDGSEPQAIAAEIGIGVRHYYREQRAAIEATANVLRDHHIVPRASPKESGEEAQTDQRLGRLEMMRLEAARHAHISRHHDLRETLAGVVSVLGGLMAERHSAVRQSIPVSLPQYAHDQNLVRQLLLGLVAYLVETSRGSTIDIRACRAGNDICLGLVAKREQSAPVSSDDAPLSRLEELEELARAAQVSLVHRVSGVTAGFEVTLSCGARSTVLVVDDDEQTIELFRRYLEPAGYEVISAADADSAFGLAEQMHPFAMTVDLMMPGRDGWDLLRALLQRDQTRNIPVIVCSVLRQKELALSLGATAFLEKPVAQDQLLAVLSELGSP